MFPRCHHIQSEADKIAFVEDYITTALVSTLKIIVKAIENKKKIFTESGNVSFNLILGRRQWCIQRVAKGANDPRGKILTVLGVKLINRLINLRLYRIVNKYRWEGRGRRKNYYDLGCKYSKCTTGSRYLLKIEMYKNINMFFSSDSIYSYWFCKKMYNKISG